MIKVPILELEDPRPVHSLKDKWGVHTTGPFSKTRLYFTNYHLCSQRHIRQTIFHLHSTVPGTTLRTDEYLFHHPYRLRLNADSLSCIRLSVCSILQTSINSFSSELYRMFY